MGQTIIKRFRLQKKSLAGVLSFKSISFYKSQNKNNLKQKDNYVPALQTGIVSGYIIILLARKYNNTNFWPLSISNCNSENYIFITLSHLASADGCPYYVRVQDSSKLSSSYMRQDLTLKPYQLENSCHEVHDYSAVYDFRHFINKITKYSHLIKFNCAGGRFNCWTEGSRGETTK